MAESTDSQIHEVSAGVSSTLAEQMENYTKQGTDLASGVTDVMSDYLSVTAADMVSVSESDRDMTASGQEDETQTEEEKQAQALAEAASAFGYTNLGIAQADGNINVREVPGTEAEIVGKLPNNAGCEIIGTDGDWTQIESGKVKGYVKSEYLMTGEAAIAKAQEVKQTVATVTTTTLYVRDEANTDSHVITMMPEGEELEVLEVLDGWVKIICLFRLCQHCNRTSEGTDYDRSPLWTGYIGCPCIPCFLCNTVCRKPVCMGWNQSDKRGGLFWICHERICQLWHFTSTFFKSTGKLRYKDFRIGCTAGRSCIFQEYIQHLKDLYTCGNLSRK